MPSRKIHFLVSFIISPGKAEDFKCVAQQMIAVAQKETGTQAYDWYLDAQKQNCRLLETYADADAMLQHLHGEAVQVLLPQLLQFSSVAGFEVYGEPGAAGSEALAVKKARIFAPWIALEG